MSKKKRNSAEAARAIFAQRNQKVDYNLPIQEFIETVYAFNPCKYGVAIANKITKDFEGLLVAQKASDNNGDVKNNSGLVFEIKSSYANENNEYNLTHLRGHFQNFDFYVICLISTPDFNPRFYCVHKSIFEHNSEMKLTPMNGNKISNVGNKNIDKRFTLKGEDVEKFINYYNVTGGTQYSDLEFYLLKHNGLKYRKDISHGKYFKSNKRKVAKKTAQQD